MARAGVAVSVNMRGIEEILRGNGPGGHTNRYLRQKAREVERHAKRIAPVKTGRLRNSIEAGAVRPGPRRSTIRVSTNVISPKNGAPYGIYQELGTGIFVGRGFIYPVTARALKLDQFGRRPGPRLRRGPDGRFLSRLAPREEAGFYARVRGIPGHHYMAQALEIVCAADPRLDLRFVRYR